MADEVETTEYDADELKTHRRGRPPMGSGPADVVPVRIDPELRTASEIIRETLRKFLEVA